MKVETVQTLLLYRYRYAIGYTALILLAAFALFFELGSLLPGLSELELRNAISNFNLSNIVSNPVDWIYNLMQAGFMFVIGETPFAVRLPGALIGLSTIAGMYALLKSWYWSRIAILGSIALVSSSWFLHNVRFGDSQSLILPITIFFLLAITQMFHTHKLIWVVISGIIAAIGLYSPFFIYIFITVVAFNYKYVWATLKLRKNWWIALAGLTFLLIISPLIYACVKDPFVLKELLGIPEQFPAIKELPKQFVDTFAYIFWQSESFPQLHLGTLPMLDIFTASMVALGLYHYERHLPSVRSKIVLFTLGILTVAVSIGASSTSYVVLIPFIYILAANGISTLLRQWYNIFPKNPVARTFAIVPLSILLALVFMYHYQRYFIAWPRTPEVVQAFSEKQVVLSRAIDGSQDESILVVVNEDQTQVAEFVTHSRDKATYQTLGETDSDEINNFQTVILSLEARQAASEELKKTLDQRQVQRIFSTSRDDNIPYLLYSTSTQTEE